VSTYPEVPAADIAIAEAVEYTIPPAVAVREAFVPPFPSGIFEPFHTPVVIVPILDNEDKVVTAVFTSVPVVGSVTFVAPVEVRVIEFAPLVASVEPFAIVSVPVLDDIVKPFTVLFVRASVPAKVARVPVVGSVREVAPLDVNVTLLAPENAIVAAGIVKVPVVVDTVNPLIVLFVKACVEDKSTRVTVPTGIVALVIPVDVRVNAKLPDVAKDEAVVSAPPVVIFPPSVIVLFASPVARVNVLPAVKFSVFANVKSNAPVPVERIASPVRAVADPPLIVGEVKVLFVKVSVVLRATNVSFEAVEGKEIVLLDVVDCACNVTVPEVAPGNATDPPVDNVMAVGKEIVTVPFGVEPEAVSVI
jgi:hypothetical protein